MKLEVTKDLLVGDEKFDLETHTVINKINDFLDIVDIHKKTLDCGEALNETCQSVNEYVHSIFDEEEELMRSINYHDIDNHLKEHQKLIESFESIYERMKNDNVYITSPSAIQELIDSLYQFLKSHVRKQDKKFIKTLNKKTSLKNNTDNLSNS